MTKEDAKTIVEVMVEKEDYELLISRQRDNALCDCNTIFVYAWTTKNDKKDKWEHDFQDTYGNDYSEEELMEELMKCDKYIALNLTKTIFAWQSKCYE
jgi:hypothetical protein